MTARRFTTTTQALLEAALERLSAGETLPNTIPYRDLIPKIAHQLTFMKRSDASPVTRPTDQLKLVSWLQKVEVLALGEGAPVRASDLDLPLPLRLRLILHAAEAGELAREIESILSHASHAPRRPRARPKHTASRNIASYLYQETERITGRIPGRTVTQSGIDQSSREGGEFVVLVREIFKILGVRASPEQAARDAIEEAKAQGAPKTKRRPRQRPVAVIRPASHGGKSKNIQI
jgi:hypothetical protein